MLDVFAHVWYTKGDREALRFPPNDYAREIGCDEKRTRLQWRSLGRMRTPLRYHL